MKDQTGLSYLFEGFKLIFKPGLKRYVFIPLLINLVLFAILIGLGVHYYEDFTIWVRGEVPAWLVWFTTVLWVFFVIGIGLFFTYFFTLFANMIGAPFNSALAEKVEIYLTDQKLEDESWAAMLADIPRNIARASQTFFYFIPRMILCFILFFIPIIQIVAWVFWYLFNAWIMTLMYADYYFDNHKQPFVETRLWMKENRIKCLVFGILITILNFIPIINFFIMPASVAGSVKMILDNKGSTDIK